MADVDGDGRTDVVGFGDAGVLAVRDFGWDQGWRVNRHPRMVVDVDGDGHADLLGFGDAGTYLSRSLPDGTFAPAALQVMRVGPELGSRGGWTVEDHPRELADITGDGVAEIIGFSDSSVVVSFFQEPEGFTYPETRGSNFTAGYYGWRGDRHPRVLGDVDGDRLADIVGFGYAGTWVATASRPDGIPNGWFDEAELRSSSFGYNRGWRVELHPRELADVNGDGRADNVGFGFSRTYVRLL